ncbi:MAG: mechanosensitive ion channel family protein, partial [Candidatus Micrarchaeota archaeon]
PSIYVGYSTAIIVFIVTFILLRGFKGLITTNLCILSKKTKTKLDDTLVDMLDGIGVLFYLSASLYAAAHFVALPIFAMELLYYFLLISIFYYSVKALQKLVDYGTGALADKRRKEEGKEEDTSLIRLSGQIIKLALWLVALLLFLANIGIDITPLIAGAGIGGVALAFALQNVLTDIFASFSIYFDKPFKVGDYIMVGKDDGTVKSIGIKSTRLQTLRGEELIISNKELTETRINNFKKMSNRRVDFAIGVTYQTSHKKLDKIPKIIKEVISKAKLAKFERCHFKTFGPSSLDFLITYYVLSQDYAKYLDTHQEVNMAIVKAFEKEKIDFAYPTQTIFLEK